MIADTLAGAPWLDAPACVRIVEALAGEGAETRFVGGVVRDGLLGRPVVDVDLATTWPPDETLRRLQAAGVRAVPTGLAHGTVTAVIGGRGFEITTLRKDIETDGRRAVVAFTRDWREDALRRDFTFNAMSADRSGRVYDYFGGRDDLAAGRVRFVGVAMERVREDYLRILRFFRFFAWYGSGDLDPESFEACRAGADGLAAISAERMRAELLRLLQAPDPAHALAHMAAAGATRVILGADGRDIASLIGREAAGGAPADPVLRLAALAPAGASSDALADRLKLSNAERAALRGLATPIGAAALLTPEGQRRALYRLGAAAYRRRALLAAFEGVVEDAAPALAAAEAWRPPARMPVGGADLIAAGLTRGPDVGAMLRELEAFWIDRGFVPGRDALLAEAARRISGRKETP